MKNWNERNGIAAYLQLDIEYEVDIEIEIKTEMKKEVKIIELKTDRNPNIAKIVREPLLKYEGKSNG